jgi:aminopeptidase-like protein
LFETAPRGVVADRLQRLHSKNAEREIELKAMFEEVGCKSDQLQEEIVRRKDPPNITCTLPGTTNSLIIVGAHFDHVAVGTGAVDDWSGASLLPSLYQALKKTPRRHTFMFVGFTDEEEGLAGSNFFVQHLPKDQLSAIKAVVNLECLGLGPTEVWASYANKGLLGALINVTQAMHAALKGMDVQAVGDDDTHAFRDQKLPVITIHSVTPETWPLLHSAKDNLGAIHLDDLYESYRVVSGYLAYIDTTLD